MNFEVQAGEFVALLGPEWRGEDDVPADHRVAFAPVAGRGEHWRVINFGRGGASPREAGGGVAHLPLLYGDLTAEENLRFYARMYGLTDYELRITEVLEMVGLEHRRRDLVRTYSRGMQQRLAIGRAVLHDPEIMLFDEPYTGLDQDASSMLDDVLKTVAAQGRTIVMTSHDLARAEELATRFDILSRGVIAASATQKQLKKSNLLSFYKQALAG
ncbi:MAG: ABC transporter ATP-binding protein [Anaerolineales bacterium]